MMIGQEIILLKSGDQGNKIVTCGDINFGHIPAAQAKIEVHIIGQFCQFFAGFFAGKNSCRGSVAADDMRPFSEIIFKMPGGIIAAGGDIGITAFQHIGK
ncbi:MAG: hypothetical protein J0L56_13165 [Chitinophagales bacterium]|nr:hypothetical protein [Chitinophagales bacterium]